MKPIRPILILLMLLLAACGGADSPAAAPDVAPTAVPTAAPLQPTDAPPTDAPAESSNDPATATAVAVPTETSAPPQPADPTTAAEAPPATETAVTTATAAPPPAPVAETPLQSYNTSLILDASGSMLADLGGRTRLAIAQDAVGDLSAALPATMNASLWVYGHRVEQDDQAASCQDIEQVLPLAPVDADQMDDVAHSFVAKGYTPITESMRQAAETLPTGPAQNNTIILVSDGEETCGGDPCALAAALTAADAKLTIHTIGLAVDAATRTQLQCIADAGGGSYFDAQNADDLAAALEGAAEAASNDTFELLDGLGRPSVVRVSPDGRHLYVISTIYESLLSFARDEASGKLTLIDQQANRNGTISGMTSPLGMDISPDGRHIYVSGDESMTVSIFARDEATGLPTYLGVVDALGDVDGLTGMLGLTVSPDGQSVYATGWHNGRRLDAIAVFQRDAAGGSLTRVQVAQNGVDGIDGLAEINDILVSPDNRHVYVSNVDKTLVVLARDADSGVLSPVQVLRDSQDLDWGLLGGYGMAFSPDGRFLNLAATRGSSVTTFARNAEDGTLTFASQQRDQAGPPVDDSALLNLAGVRSIALTPDGRHAYTVSAINDYLVAFARDADSGELTFVQQFKDNEAGVDGLENGYDVAISPDGRFVYATGFDDNALAVLARDPGSGQLTFVELIRGR